MLDATSPELDSPALATTVDASKAWDVNAVRLDRLQRGGLIQRNLGDWRVVAVRVHSLAILTCCSGSPAEESPLRLRKARDAHCNGSRSTVDRCNKRSESRTTG